MFYENFHKVKGVTIKPGNIVAALEGADGEVGVPKTLKHPESTKPVPQSGLHERSRTKRRAPLFIKLHARRVRVSGGGAVACWKRAVLAGAG